MVLSVITFNAAAAISVVISQLNVTVHPQCATTRLMRTFVSCSLRYCTASAS